MVRGVDWPLTDEMACVKFFLEVNNFKSKQLNRKEEKRTHFNCKGNTTLENKIFQYFIQGEKRPHLRVQLFSIVKT